MPKRPSWSRSRPSGGIWMLHLWRNTQIGSLLLYVTIYHFSCRVLSWSWLIYALSALVIITCAYFAYCERCRRTESVRRRRVIQRAQERYNSYDINLIVCANLSFIHHLRPPQKRRPNAAYRDHQIYRHIILSVAKYMKNPDGIRPFIEHMEQLYPLRHNLADQQQVAEPSAGED